MRKLGKKPNSYSFLNIKGSNYNKLVQISMFCAAICEYFALKVGLIDGFCQKRTFWYYFYTFFFNLYYDPPPLQTWYAGIL